MKTLGDVLARYVASLYDEPFALLGLFRTPSHLFRKATRISGIIMMFFLEFFLRSETKY